MPRDPVNAGSVSVHRSTLYIRHSGRSNTVSKFPTDAVRRSNGEDEVQVRQSWQDLLVNTLGYPPDRVQRILDQIYANQPPPQ